MKKKIRAFSRRSFSLFLALTMVLSLSLANAYAADTDTENLLMNGDFETGNYDGWTVNVSDDQVFGEWSVRTDEWDSNVTNYLQLSNYTGAGRLTAEAVQTIELKAGTYTASVKSAGADEGGTASSLLLSAVSEETTLAEKAVPLNGWSEWTTTEVSFTLEEDASVTVGITGKLADSSYCDLDDASLVLVSDGDAEENGEGYTITAVPSTVDITAGDTVTLNITVKDSGTEVTDLAAAGLSMTTWSDYYESNGHGDGNADAVIASPNDLATTVTLPSEGIYYLVTELYDSEWNVLTSVTTTLNVAAAAPEEGDDTVVEADINVEKVPGLSDDFIMGMDISSVISEFNSGVTYQDFDGNIIDNVSDFCKFLAECGVTHVRVRVWNDPYDSNGNGYGGGDNDIETAVKIAEGCADAGLKMLVDFHCSDFWTDPSKQQTPKAWEGYTLDKKADALKSFLTDSLTKLAATGADIDMVQVGNETNNAFIGESDTADMCTLFNAGSEAIRAFNDSIKVVIHVTNPESSNMTKWAGILDSNNVDYDVLATSYYPSWHGTLANLKSQLQTVKDTYGKDVMVAETSYAFTLEDTDGHDNTIHEGNNTDMMTETQYPFTPQGQASFLRDVIDTVNQAGGLGVYYWESAWITVGDTTGLEGEEYSARVDANKELWEKYGSGWASSYSAQYDPDDAGLWYGGSAVDNQAMFDSDGSALASINVWKLVKTGAVSNHVSVDAIVSPSETIEAGEGYTLPEVVTVTYNSGEVEEEVSWNESDISTANPDIAGTYVINGTVTFSKEVDSGEYAGKSSAPVTFTLTVKEPNRIPADVAGFEVADDSAFTIVGTGINLPATDDPKEGSRSMHWYSAAAEVDTVTYDTPITLEPGRYTFEISAQGYTGDTVSVRILDTAGEVLFSGDPVSMAGWAVWQTPSISFALSEKTDVLVQIEVDMQAEGWGTADCMYLYRTGDVTTEPEDPAEPEIPADPTVPSTDVSDNVGQTGGQADKPSGSLSSEKETGNSTDSGSSAAPKTGVSENVGIWIFLLAAAGVAIIKYVRFTEKQKN